MIPLVIYLMVGILLAIYMRVKEAREPIPLLHYLIVLFLWPFLLLMISNHIKL